MSLTKILIANRGEIACRIIRTAQALGYGTVAVFTAVDADAPHVRMADRATVVESYLDSQQLIDAAKRTGADAIHPGYGFLSENGDFAQQVIASELIWIGPSPQAMIVMGSKMTAKEMVALHDVPLLPGYAKAEQDDDAFIMAADAIGYPVMVKAAAGGGGRGMRLVTDKADLPSALASARSEALQAFGSADLLLEKALINPRHIEFQIFGDQHGNIIHLGARDCSIQRRHQKVIEEAGEIGVTVQTLTRMGQAAIAVAKSVNYVSAGTVEFLLDQDDNFYFIEMNTRLQVEHPVTEIVTGLDLVKWQLRIAAGEPLPLTQDDVQFNGHAIEVRLYAENDDFFPSIGTILHYRPPTGIGIRVDDGVRTGSTITPYYDAMIAKIIAYGETRAIAQRRLRRALEETVVLGIETNRRFLLDAIAHPKFVAGNPTTHFIAQMGPQTQGAPPPLSEALAAVIHYQQSASQYPHLGGWGSWEAAYCFKSENLIRISQGTDLWVTNGDWRLHIAIVACEANQLIYQVGSVQDVVHFAFDRDNRLWLQANGLTFSFQDRLLVAVDAASSTGSGHTDTHTDGRILAPMPGIIRRINVASDETVTQGQPLLVLEAMKMEHTINAPVGGKIENIQITIGQQVQSNKLMLIITPRADL